MNDHSAHRGQKVHPLAHNPDNFIGVELHASYFMGQYQYDSIYRQAECSCRKALQVEMRRLSRYFHDPIVYTGDIRFEVLLETNERGKDIYRLHAYQTIEIVERT